MAKDKYTNDHFFKYKNEQRIANGMTKNFSKVSTNF